MAVVAIDNGAPRPSPSTLETAPPASPADNEVKTRAAAEGRSVEGKPEKEKKKKKKKARDAWISFVGRILAQVVGAAATIFLGVYVVSRSNAPSKDAALAREAAALAGEAAAPPAVRSVSRSGDVPTIVVLPLQNFSGDPGQEYFADGMTEALIADLAQVKGLRVISRTSSMLYKTQPKPVPQVAQELGVGLIVEGSVARSGDRIRITAQLIDAERDEHLWARTYDRTSRDVFGLQAEVAAAIVGEVKGMATAAAHRSRLQTNKAVDPVAYDLYLRGRHAWNDRTAQGFAEAERYFDEAIRLDPNFALAHAGLADVYQLSGSPLSGAPTTIPDAPAKARAAAQRALELDEGLAEAHTSLAGVLQRVDGDVTGAEREFLRALELNPGYATAHQWYAILLAEDDRDADAVRHAKEAVTLDPLSGAMRQTLGIVHYQGRRFEAAILDERRALEFSPHLALARDILARALLATGKVKDAIVVAEQQSQPRSAETLATLAIAYVRGGDRRRAAGFADELNARQPLPAVALARWYASTSDYPRALELLTRTASEGAARALPLSLADPVFDPVRSDPRFQDILRRFKSQHTRPKAAA